MDTIWTAAIFLGVVILISGYIWIIRKGHGQVADGFREHAYDEYWRPFMLGYEEALADIQLTGPRPPFILGYEEALEDVLRTGHRPFADKSVRDAAERAFRRIYIERQPGSLDG